MDTTSMSPLSEVNIVLVEPNDENDASHDMEDFPTDFLLARTKSFPRAELDSPDQSMVWDSFVVTSASDCSSPVEHMASMEIGNQVSDICNYLVDIFGDPHKYAKFLCYRDSAAQDLLDLLQKLLDHAPLDQRFRGVLYVALVRLCRKSALYPRCFSLEDVNVNFQDPLSNGGFGDVYKANQNGRVVCAKVIRIFQTSNQALLHKSFSREAVVWGQLSHPNILPFYGIHRLEDPRKRLCLISPWMTNGNVTEYLKTRPQLVRTPLIQDVALGLEYLHENGVVHGDLKSLNILVTDSERACLADFGLSYVTDLSGFRGQAFSSNHAEGGTPGFEAPELVDPDNEFSRRTKASDVYAFGMVCYEMFTGERPFKQVKKQVALITRIMQGQHPEKPSGNEYQERGLTDNMWSLMESCWDRLPENRPTVAHILQHLPHLESERQRPEEWTHSRRPGFDSTNGQADSTLTTALPHIRSLLIEF